MIRASLKLAVASAVLALVALPAQASEARSDKRTQHPAPENRDASSRTRDENRSSPSEASVSRSAGQPAALKHPFREQVRWLEARV